MIHLRDYQRAAIDALYRWFDGQRGNPLVVVPTGGGKSVILAEFIRSALEVDPDTRVIVATHVRELIAQNYHAMLRAWPEAPVGIYSAGIGRREHDSPILFCGIQSVYDKAESIGRADLLIVDEAHLTPRKGEGMYRTFVNALLSMNSLLKVIGLTATPYRTDSGRLDEGPDRLFSGVAYDCDIVSLIESGWLSPVVGKGTKATIDTSAVHVRGGDFIPSELEQAAMAGDVVERAVAELVARASDRKAWLVFCVGIDHANAVAERLRKHDVDCETIFGDTNKHERDAIIARFKAGNLRCIVNVGVLTTGFDAPHVDLIALLRPTKSPGLYVQMVGRGLRTAPGKTDCLVLDFGGNVARHGPIDHVQPADTGGSDKPKVRTCPVCLSFLPLTAKACDCGYVFPVVEREQSTHEPTPDEQRALIAGKHPTGGIERWDVQHVSYREHRKPGKPVSMRVEYICGVTRYVSEWVCFEHDGYARRKAEQWWLAHGGNLPVPETVDLALCRIEGGALFEPIQLVVDVRGRYPEIKGCRLGPGEPGLNEGEVPLHSEGTRADDEDPIPF